MASAAPELSPAEPAPDPVLAQPSARRGLGTRARRVLLTFVAASALLAAGVVIRGIGVESTDDAFVEGHVVIVGARVLGHVRRVLVRDNQLVEAGAPLVELDPAELEARYEAASADFAAAEAQILAEDKAEPWANQAKVALSRARLQQASAAKRLAEVNLGFATIRAPLRGYVSRRSVEPGQIVTPGMPLLAVVPLDDVWVVANFKEDQIGGFKPGLKATVRVDSFAGEVFEAKVDSVAAASGAKFALLPPDNASGNFVKVVQRVPVLLRFDQPLGQGVVLRPGMSAEVEIKLAR